MDCAQKNDKTLKGVIQGQVMDYSKFLEHPEQFRDAPNYRATHIVFPIEIGREENLQGVVKMERQLNPAIQAWYLAQDRFFFGGTREWAKPGEALAREARVLEELAGYDVAPTLLAYDDKRHVLLREHIVGRNFRELSDKGDLHNALTHGFASLEEIHTLGSVIGDAHVKNLNVQGGRARWLDFDGVYDENDKTQAAALDILKFVYSTWTVTRSREHTLHAAGLAAGYSVDNAARERVLDLVSPGPSACTLWLPTRVPPHGRLNDEIKAKLRL